MKFNQGDIVLIPFPFTDLSSIKRRPVLILSKHNHSEDIIVCGITSNLKDSTHSVVLEQRSLSSGKLPKKSCIKVDKLFTLEKSLVQKKFGTVSSEVMSKVRNIFLQLV